MATANPAAAQLGPKRSMSQQRRAMMDLEAVGPSSLRPFHVIRNGQDLGDLSARRLALEIWVEEEVTWTIRNGGAGRRRGTANK